MEDKGSISLNPSKSESFDGCRDYLVVNSWLYKIEQYIVLMELGTLELKLQLWKGESIILGQASSNLPHSSRPFRL